MNTRYLDHVANCRRCSGYWMTKEGPCVIAEKLLKQAADDMAKRIAPMPKSGGSA